MPRSRKVENKKRATRTIRVYETQAVLIEYLVRRAAKNTTIADVVEEWASSLYPKGNTAIEQVGGAIEDAISADEEAERHSRIAA